MNNFLIRIMSVLLRNFKFNSGGWSQKAVIEIKSPSTIQYRKKKKEMSTKDVSEAFQHDSSSTAPQGFCHFW